MLNSLRKMFYMLWGLNNRVLQYYINSNNMYKNTEDQSGNLAN